MTNSNTLAETNTVETKKRTVNHPYLALIIMVIITSISTYFIPAGVFKRVVDEATGRTVVDPSSFQFVESHPTGIGDFFMSFPSGFLSSASIIGSVLFVGGSFAVLRGMGIIDIAVDAIRKMGKRTGIIPITLVIMTFLFLETGFSGWRDLDVIFITVAIPICLSLGYDTAAALGMVLIASCAGFSASIANAYSIGILQSLAGLPMFSAMGYRLMVGVVFFIAGVFFIIRYLKKIEKDPTKALMYGTNVDELNREQFLGSGDTDVPEFTLRKKLAAITWVGLFIYFIYGAISLGFGFNQISAVFMAMNFVPGLIGGLKPNEICEYMTQGAKEMLPTAMILLFARSILVIMEQAQIIDTIIYGLSGMVQGLHEGFAAVMIYVVQTMINFVIPSGSGQAVVTGPIIIPLGDIAEVNRQVTAMASAMGDGITNYLYPSNGILMGVLAIAKIPWSKWVKFFFPLFVFYAVLAAVFIYIAQVINLGPF